MKLFEDNENQVSLYNGQGFVRLIDHYGSDATIVQSARISYGDGTKTPSEDRTLIRYLMRNWHTSPFEQVEVRFHIRIPIDVARHLVRHRMAAINEVSTRYSLAIEETMELAPGEWRKQSTSNKQGGEEYFSSDEGHEFSQLDNEIQFRARETYEKLVAKGVSREQARRCLPLSQFTEIYWKQDLHNLFHMLRLRMDKHAQKETRDMANAMFKLIQPLFPMACDAFLDYRLETMNLSRLEILALREAVLVLKTCDREKLAKIITNKRELGEFMEKLATIEGDDDEVLSRHMTEVSKGEIVPLTKKVDE